jgi:hypothetical protein
MLGRIFRRARAWPSIRPLPPLAEAFGITIVGARIGIKTVRDWLGVNPRTGEKHLPDVRCCCPWATK